MRILIVMHLLLESSLLRITICTFSYLPQKLPYRKYRNVCNYHDTSSQTTYSGHCTTNDLFAMPFDPGLDQGPNIRCWQHVSSEFKSNNHHCPSLNLNSLSPSLFHFLLVVAIFTHTPWYTLEIFCDSSFPIFTRSSYLAIIIVEWKLISDRGKHTQFFHSFAQPNSA